MQDYLNKQIPAALAAHALAVQLILDENRQNLSVEFGALSADSYPNQLFFSIYEEHRTFEEAFRTHVAMALTADGVGFYVGFVTLPEGARVGYQEQFPGLEFDGQDEEDYVQLALWIENYLVHRTIPTEAMNS